jgi:predicted transcriptional regulator
VSASRRLRPTSNATARRKAPEKLFRALSIRQPYAELILRGAKRAEFRTRLTHFRGRVYLYTSKPLGSVEWGLRRGLTIADIERLPRGTIVGSIDLVGCDRLKDGSYAWRLAKPRRYRSPIVPRGCPQPGFWYPTL